MTTSGIEDDIRAALEQRAGEVSESSVEVVRRARYAPRTSGLRRRVAVAAAGALVGVRAALAAAFFPRPSTQTGPRLHLTPLAYVGTAPRLTVTVLPAGFQPGPDIP